MMKVLPRRFYKFLGRFIPEMAKKIDKKFSVGKIIGFESGTTNFLNFKKSTYH